MTTLRARSDRRFIRSTHRSERFVLVELEACLLGVGGASHLRSSATTSAIVAIR